MPQLFSFGPYVFFFWVGEDGEPVHVQVAVRRPAENATKFWLTADGGCVLASNGSDIPRKDLRDLEKIVRFNHRRICERWAQVFGQDSVRFYL